MSTFSATSDYWELTPVPGTITEAARGLGVSVGFVDSGAQWLLALGQHPTLTSDREGPPDLSGLLGSRVTSLRVLKTGRLEVKTDRGVLIAVDPRPDVEAWEIGKDGEVVALALSGHGVLWYPGWGDAPESEPYTITLG